MRGTPGQRQTAPTSAPSTSQTSRAYTYPPGQPSHSRSNVVTASGGSAGDGNAQAKIYYRVKLTSALLSGRVIQRVRADGHGPADL